MKKLFLLLAISVLAFVLACAKPAPPVNIESANANIDSHQEDDAPRIALADAKKDFDDGAALFIDTRGEDAYRMEHIKGAINIPAGNLELRMKDVPKDRKIIAYCS